MGVSNIKASTGAMVATAEDIKSKANQYAAAYQQIYSDIEALRATWTSEDAEKYIAKIKDFEPSFEQLNNALVACANSIITDATNYNNALAANLRSI